MDVANDWQSFTLNTSFSRHSLPVGSCGPSCSPEQLMLQVHVSFPSGYGETLALPPNSTVGDLKVLVQKTFRQGFLRLVTEKGHVLANHEDSLLAAGIQEGMHLTVVAQKPKVAATSQAFAVWCCGGDRIATWGEQCYGGDSSAVQDHLKNVQQVQGTMGAFAAILADGSVVTWGDRNSGGDSSAVQDQLQEFQQQGTRMACHQTDPSLPGASILWMLCSSRSAQECPAGARHKHDPSLPEVEPSILWRSQLCSSRSAQECPAGARHKHGFCCHLSRWIRRYLGPCKLWW